MGISLSFLNQLTPYSIILKRNKIILHQQSLTFKSVQPHVDMCHDPTTQNSANQMVPRHITFNLSNPSHYGTILHAPPYETTIAVRLKLRHTRTIHVVANHSHAKPPLDLRHTTVSHVGATTLPENTRQHLQQLYRTARC